MSKMKKQLLRARRCHPLIAICALSGSLLFGATPRVNADTFTVTSNLDAGAGTLRQAIIDANGNGEGDTINIVVEGKIALADPLPALSENVTINGPGASKLTVQGRSGAGYVFWGYSGEDEVNASLSGLTITGSNFGIHHNNSGTLNITECVVTGNTNTGIANVANGTVNINRCAVSDSEVGILNELNDGEFQGTVHIANSTVNGHSEIGVENFGTLSLTNSTISGNATGIHNRAVEAILIGTMAVTHCTVAGNSSLGLKNETEGMVTLTNSLVVDNETDVESATDDLILAGNNLSGMSALAAGLDSAGLKENGGPTKTIALVNGGAAVNAGDNAFVGGLSTDQRGGVFVRIFGDTVDIGAYELNAATTPNEPPANQAPTAIALGNSSVEENKVEGTIVGSFSTTDPDADNTFTYELVTGEGDSDNASFTIEEGTLKTAASFNYEAKDSYSIRVRSTDQGGLSFAKEFVIAVSNVNETPDSISLSNSSVDENVAIGTTVGNLSTTDPDAPKTAQTFNYALVNGAGDTNNGSFNLSTEGVLTVNTALDYETQNSYSIRVRSTDQGGLSTTATFTITVKDVDESLPANQAPVNIVPGTQTTMVNTALVFTGANAISVSDADAGNAPVQVSLQSTQGNFTLTLPAVNAPSVTGSATNSTAVTLTGTIAQINSALNGLKFQPAPNFKGTATLGITTNDLGNTGTGGAKSDSDTISINVVKTNSAPVAVADTYKSSGNFTVTDIKAGVVANDHDRDGDALVVDGDSVKTHEGTYGYLTLNANGTFEYRLKEGVTKGAESFIYKARDNGNPSLASAHYGTIHITITPAKNSRNVEEVEAP